MAENYYTHFETLVGGGGYAAGSGILNVVATSPTAANFRVIITDPVTGAYKALLKVTGINSSTQFAVTVDPGGVDANCAAGDMVRSNVTADALATIIAEATAPFSAADLALSPMNNLPSTNANWQNFTLFACIRGESLYGFPASFKIRMLFTAGSPVIGAMKILKTASRSLSVLSSTTVTIGGNAAPTLTTPGRVDTDSISLQLDGTHDYWFAIFFTNTGANASVSVANAGPAILTGGHNAGAGDSTGVSTIPAMSGGAPPYLVIGAIRG